MRSALAPGLRWHEAGNPEIMGRDAVLQRMSGAVKRIDGNIAVHDVLAIAAIQPTASTTRRSEGPQPTGMVSEAGGGVTPAARRCH